MKMAMMAGSARINKAILGIRDGVNHWKHDTLWIQANKEIVLESSPLTAIISLPIYTFSSPQAYHCCGQWYVDKGQTLACQWEEKRKEAIQELETDQQL